MRHGVDIWIARNLTRRIARRHVSSRRERFFYESFNSGDCSVWDRLVFPYRRSLEKFSISFDCSTLIWDLWLSERNSEDRDGSILPRIDVAAFDVTSKKLFAEPHITRSSIAMSATFPKSKIPQRTTCLESIWGDCRGFDEGLIERRYEHVRYSAGTRRMRSATSLKSHRGGSLHHSIVWKWS